MSVARVLVVDSDPTYRTSVSRCLTNHSYQVTAVDSGQRALHIISSSSFELLITDLKTPDMSVFDFLSKIRELSPATATIVMADCRTKDNEKETPSAEDCHYIVKPFSTKDLLTLCVAAVKNRRNARYNARNKVRPQKRETLPGVVAESPVMKGIIKSIKKISVSECNVIVTGESGTGKDFLARLIHRSGTRDKNDFTSIDCAKLDDSSIDAALFSKESTSKPALSIKGTIFLTNVERLSSRLQKKIASLEGSGYFYPVESKRSHAQDLRFILSTTKSMKEIRSYYKPLFQFLNSISAIPLEIPPLRERKEDIPDLVRSFTLNYSDKSVKEAFEFPAEVMEIILDYPWPGNLSELKTLLERLLTTCDKRISIDDIPPEYKYFPTDLGKKVYSESILTLPRLLIPDEGINLNQIISKVEEDLILQALKKTDWNKNRAAKLLKLNRTTLVEKLRKKGMLNSRPRC